VVVEPFFLLSSSPKKAGGYMRRYIERVKDMVKVITEMVEPEKCKN